MQSKIRFLWRRSLNFTNVHFLVIFHFTVCCPWTSLSPFGAGFPRNYNCIFAFRYGNVAIFRLICIMHPSTTPTSPPSPKGANRSRMEECTKTGQNKVGRKVGREAKDGGKRVCHLLGDEIKPRKSSCPTYFFVCQAYLREQSLIFPFYLLMLS